MHLAKAETCTWRMDIFNKLRDDTYDLIACIIRIKRIPQRVLILKMYSVDSFARFSYLQNVLVPVSEQYSVSHLLRVIQSKLSRDFSTFMKTF